MLKQQKKFKIKKDDEVIVIAGKDKGKSGKVTKVLKDTDRLIVQGINMVKRHTKPSATSAGGIIAKELSIHISNVAVRDPSTNKPTKVGYKHVDGTKKRIARKSGELIDG